MAFTFKLENPDGTPADPPTLKWSGLLAFRSPKTSSGGRPVPAGLDRRSPRCALGR
jgi:hypothetical protein